MSGDIGRVRVAKKLGLHPMMSSEVEEGVHYEVVATKLWGDVFVPVAVEWCNGEFDDLRDVDKSLENYREVLEK